MKDKITINKMVTDETTQIIVRSRLRSKLDWQANSYQRHQLPWFASYINAVNWLLEIYPIDETTATYRNDGCFLSHQSAEKEHECENTNEME
jgi:hypothetical protein